MKKRLLLILVILASIISSCKYDDGELWQSVEDLASQVSALENLTKQKNGDIEALQSIVNALEDAALVSEVEKSTDGYILHFTNGTTATIRNGVDGKDGMDAPTVYFAEENGIYYWTLTTNGKTSWLIDADGQRIPVSASSAPHGSTGNNGNKGVTPMLQVSKDGFWKVSTDNGKTYDFILDDGEKIKAVGTMKGEDGIESIFKGEYDSDDHSITIYLKDGTSYTFSRMKSVTIYSDAECKNEIKDTKSIEVGTLASVTFYYKAAFDHEKVELIADAGIQNYVWNSAEHKISFEITERALAGVRAVLFLYSGDKTITKVFKFKVAPWTGQVLEVVPENDIYKVYTPEELAWIAEKSGEDSFVGKTIELYNDIDLANYPWTPIGQNSNKPFSGIFLGNGYTIKGLSVKDEVLQSKALSRNSSTIIKGRGLFGVVENAKLSGVTIQNAVVDVQDKEVAGTGILVGCALGEVTIEDIKIEKKENADNEEQKTEVKGGQNVGSVAGLVSGSNITISNCEVKSTSLNASSDKESTEKTSVGGVIGTLELKAGTGESGTPQVTIEGCKVDGIDLSTSSDSEGTEGNSAAGGVVGSLKVDETVKESVQDLSSIITIANNGVSNTQVTSSSDSTESEPTEQQQGAVVGNLAELDADVSVGIITGNEVSEDVQIETQLTMANLSKIMEAVLAEKTVSSFDVKGDIEESTEIMIPQNGTDVTLNFAGLMTRADKVLTVSQGEGTTAGNSTHKITINVPTGDNGQYLVIKAPEASVTLASGSYSSVTALTAKNTLCVDGAMIQNLVIKGGVVRVTSTGKITGEIKTTSSEPVYLILESGATVGNNLPATIGDNIILTNSTTYDLTYAAKYGGTVTLTENVRLVTPLVVEADMTLITGDYFLGGTTGKDFSDPDGLKTLIAVKPGGTFTVADGCDQLNTGQNLEQLSVIRLLGGDHTKTAKVIINSGWLIGTYYGIWVDKTCTNGEVIMNGASVQGDFNHKYNGLGIFNQGQAKITIQGGTVQGHGSAIEMQGGELEITGGEFISHQTQLITGEKANPNVGNTLIGPALSIAPQNNVIVNISGGTFSDNGHSSLYHANVLNGIQSTTTLSITDGIFNKTVWSNENEAFVSGGLYKVKIDDKFIVKGKVLVKDGDYYTIKDAVNDGNTSGDKFDDGGEY